VDLVVAVGALSEKTDADELLDTFEAVRKGAAKPGSLDDAILLLRARVREAPEPRARGGLEVLGLLEAVMVRVVAVDADIRLRPSDVHEDTASSKDGSAQS
jgi:hypothetical protein